MPEAQPRWRSRRVQVARILVGVFGFILLNLLWAVFLLSQLPPPIAFPSTAVSVLIAGLVFALPFTREPGLNDGIVVDEGGLRWRKGKKRGYVFLRDIEDVGYAGVLGSPAIRVETNGGRLRLFTGGLPENLFIDDLNTRIAGLHSRDPHHEHADLARGGRSLATWLAEVRAARGVSEDAAYRTNERAPRDLLELACDRDADAEERAAAAHLKAMAPILSQGGLAIITPSSTNPDLTDPKFAQQYRPAGKAIYFRTVTTDAYQGPNMADFFAEKLGVKAIYVLDDQGAYGVGMADAFQKRIADKGVKVLGRDQLDPKAADYSAILTKIKSLNADSLYYGGVGTAGVKLIKQSYDILPTLKKGGGDGIYGGDLLKGAGFPAIAGWYATIAAPHMTEDTKLATWMADFKKKYGAPPEDYSITSYDAATVIIDAIKTVAATGKPVTREAVRDAIQAGKFKTLQGDISYDPNGDLNSKVVSVFQVQQNDKAPLDDTNAQFHYIGVAPTS